MKKFLFMLATIFMFTGISIGAEKIIKTDRVQESPLMEKMLGQIWRTQSTFMVSSEYPGDLSAETGHVVFRMPYACKLLGVRANVDTVPTADMVIDINEAGTTLLSTKLYIQSGSETSVSSYLATSPTGSEYVISDNIIADDAEITIDIDSTTGGQGLKFTFYVEPTNIPTNY